MIFSDGPILGSEKSPVYRDFQSGATLAWEAVVLPTSKPWEHGYYSKPFLKIQPLFVGNPFSVLSSRIPQRGSCCAFQTTVRRANNKNIKTNSEVHEYSKNARPAREHFWCKRFSECKSCFSEKICMFSHD